MFKLDFSDKRTDDTPFSCDDKRFLKRMTEGVHQQKKWHYELPLPLKNDDIKLPNNKDMGFHRLMKLRTNLINDL